MTATIKQLQRAVENAHNDYGNPSKQLSKARAALTRARKAQAAKCMGHEPEPTEEPQGVTVYCDGSCAVQS